ncbi:MAG: hypothetical protein JO100_11425 [Pseudonocardia sp.]|nr:hypothetical protein [Pseudonocardia sp.]
MIVLVESRARVAELRRRGLWPAQVPAVVLAEALTGDLRRDHGINRLLSTCQIRGVDELHGREAGRLRASTGRAGTIAATDALVVAMAAGHADAVVLTSDPHDITALAVHATRPVTVLAT